MMKYSAGGFKSIIICFVTEHAGVPSRAPSALIHTVSHPVSEAGAVGGVLSPEL